MSTIFKKKIAAFLAFMVFVGAYPRLEHLKGASLG
jgi:hypothetical protein